jgi:hypothetical protein
MAVVMASKSKRSRYRGALASPIARQPPPSFWGAVTPKRLDEYYRSVARHERKQAKEIERHLSRKFSLLFDHYGIKDRRNTRALAWALAREHVKGFQLVKPTNKKRGRRSVWDGERLEQLLNTVESVQRAHLKFTDRRALRFMITTEPYSAIWAPSENHKGSEDQWLEFILAFTTVDKEMVLNSTNKNALVDVLGKRPADWIGAEVGIYTESTTYSGKPTRGLRLRVLNKPATTPPPKASAQPAPKLAAAEETRWPDQPDDPGPEFIDAAE